MQTKAAAALVLCSCLPILLLLLLVLGCFGLASAQWAAAPGRLAGTVQRQPVRSRAGPGQPLLGRWGATGKGHRHGAT
jgi:hypothetical protein